MGFLIFPSKKKKAKPNPPQKNPKQIDQKEVGVGVKIHMKTLALNAKAWISSCTAQRQKECKAGGVAQLGGCLPASTEPRVLPPAAHKPVIPVLRRQVEARGSEGQGHPLLESKL